MKEGLTEATARVLARAAYDFLESKGLLGDSIEQTLVNAFYAVLQAPAEVLAKARLAIQDGVWPKPKLEVARKPRAVRAPKATSQAVAAQPVDAPRKRGRPRKTIV